MRRTGTHAGAGVDDRIDDGELEEAERGRAMESERIQEQLKFAFEGEAWHGPSVLEVLANVDARTAAARPLPDAHSIWELVLHMATWEAVVTARLRGGKLEVTPEIDWPPVTDTSEASWQAARAALVSGHEALRAGLEGLDDSRLSEQIGPRTLYHLLHGVIQHDLYHAGQIAVLKKARA